MNTKRRIAAAAIALAAGLFLTGCDDPENEDTQDPAETSIQQDENGGDTREDGPNEGDDAGDDEGEGIGNDDSDTDPGDADDEPGTDQ